MNPEVTSNLAELLSKTPDTKSLLCVTKIGKNPGALTHIYKSQLDSTLINGPRSTTVRLRLILKNEFLALCLALIFQASPCGLRHNYQLKTAFVNHSKITALMPTAYSILFMLL